MTERDARPETEHAAWQMPSVPVLVVANMVRMYGP
jgi:hypothetical protein